jgi:bifunctional DNase/RNase
MNDNNLVQVYIKKVSSTSKSLENREYRVVELGEVSGERVMRIMIGGSEASFLLEKVNKNMIPTNYSPISTIVSIIKKFKIVLREVVIYSIKNFVVKSKLILEQGLDIEEIDVKFSDGLLLAAMMKTPIFVDKGIIEMFFFDAKDAPSDDAELTVQKLTLRELRTELAKAVAGENYERAAEIRDEIKKREEMG